MEFLAIEASLKADLLLAATRHQQSPEMLAHDILKKFLDMEKEAELGLLEANEAWLEFEQTGEGVPLEEAASWLRSWGSPNPQPSPLCRKL